MNQPLHPRTLPPKYLHISLFGETSVGKSSLINLLARWQVASVSPDGAPCTLDSSEYQFQLGSTTPRLWETVGVEEPESLGSEWLRWFHPLDASDFPMGEQPLTSTTEDTSQTITDFFCSL
ncbi:hypothetical protein J3R82DRAFT_6585 [Butyriboletus roseoflavus]|nr:hypothetical protein J3R82DRAFT_6585 [Butyriboletus roseoflavus]